MKHVRCRGALARLTLSILVAAALVPAMAFAYEPGTMLTASSEVENSDAVNLEPVLTGIYAEPATDEQVAQVLSVLPATSNAAGSSLSAQSESSGATLSAQASSAGSVKVSSYYGQTFQDTAAEQAKAAFPKGSERAIIAGPGGSWVDALSSAGLAASVGPILFSERNELGEAAADALKALGVKSVIIVGGPLAVGTGVESDLKDLGIKLEKRLYGQTEYDTQMAIYEYGVDNNLWKGDMAIIATALSYADALSVSPVAYAGRVPIFLTGSNLNLNAKQKAALSAATEDGKFSTKVITGGKLVVSEACEKWLGELGGKVTRLGGETLYDTSALIASWSIGTRGFKWNNAAFATGEAPYDALAGSVFQGRAKAPLLLVNSTSNATVKLVAENKGGISALRFFGGPLAISDDLRASIRTLLSDAVTYEATGITYAQMLAMEYDALKQTSLGYSRSEVNESLDPDAFSFGDAGFYEFAVLNSGYSGKVTAEQLDAFLARFGSGGTLEGTGAYFIEAAQKYGVNEVYLMANAILESGWGRSSLARGTEIDDVTYYNFFGIGAYDSDPEGGGSRTANQYGWDSPRAAILGAGKWISDRYHNNSYSQNTLYKMRWNYRQASTEHAVWMQYATGRQWATGIAGVMDSFYDYADISMAESGLTFLLPYYS